MSYIYWLSQIQRSEQSVVGDKLYILSQLLCHEHPILPGFVLGNDLWQKCVDQLESEIALTDYSPDLPLNVGSDRYLSLQLAAQQNRQMIEQIVLPEALSKQIFAAAQQLNAPSLILQPVVTFPYQQNIAQNLWRSPTCSNSSQSLNTAIKQVWSEFFTANALLYWQGLDLKIQDLCFAVLVRPLKPAYASGIVELNSDFVRIKASWGLEHSLLQGDVEPDEYYVDRSTGYTLSQHLGHKNYAYQPQAVNSSTANDCLTAYIPEVEQTEIYALDQQAIAKLLELTQAIVDQQPQIKYLTWTSYVNQVNFDGAISDGVPQFFFTQFETRLPTVFSEPSRQGVTQNFLGQDVPALLTGIAAAPGLALAEVVVVTDFDLQAELITDGCILVANYIPPRHVHLLKRVAGIITETGGKTSHGAIIARELNIPGVVNATGAIAILQNEAEVMINGDEGKIYAPEVKKPALKHLSSRGVLAPNYPIATKLMLNLSQPEGIARALSLPVDGVGLLRSELMLADLLTTQFWHAGASTSAKQHRRRSFFDKLASSLRQFVSAFAPRPVFYRSLDWYAQDSLNPILGNRGTYSYISDPSLFDLELEAIVTLISEGYTNLNLILPYVRTVEEFKFCYRRLENIGLNHRSSFQVWVMAEVPSMLFLLPEYVRAGVQGIAIGTNDLTQLLLGVDREQAQFGDRGLNANHPAILQAIQQLVTTAKANNIQCCICGQAPVDYPELIEQLIAWGIDAISVESEAVERTYRVIARAERKMLLNLLDQNLQ